MENSGARPNGRRREEAPFLRKAGLYVAIAFELPGTILGGLLVGYFLDRYLDTSPWFLITLAALAFVTAIARLMRWVKLLSHPRNGREGPKNHMAH